MSLKKLYKTHEGLEDEVNTLVEKAADKAAAGATKAAKAAIAETTKSIKELGLDKAATKAVVEQLNSLKAGL